MNNVQANRLFLTNDYSIVSKYSAVKSCYFTDDILEDFVANHLKTKTWRRTPLVNRGYSARLLAMDWILKRSLINESLHCVIVLGAGYDTLSLNLADRCNWIEIDLPEVVNTKSDFIRRRQLPQIGELHEVEPGLHKSSASNYHLLSCDLRDRERLRLLLRQTLTSLGPARNFAIVNEVCLSYLELEEIKSVMASVIDCIQEQAWRIHYIGYEPVKSSDHTEMSEVMTQHFKSLGHPLKFFPTRNDLRQLFLEYLGFNHLTISSMYQIYHNALLARKLETKTSQLEPFDEFEEMDSYLSHYALVTGVLVVKDPFFINNRESGLLSSVADLKSQLDCIHSENYGKTGLMKSSLQRFGHSCCILKGRNQSVLISGGFGKQQTRQPDTSNQHKRLGDCLIFKKEKDKFDVVTLGLTDFPTDSICLDRMHGQLSAMTDELVFFNGGRQSPSKLNSSNLPFIARIHDDNRLTVVHKFTLDGSQNETCWRHMLSTILNNKIVQVGGISVNPDFRSEPLIWNFSSDKLGYKIIPSGNSEILSRHTFGMDAMDENTLLVFGGLQTSQQFEDRPVDCERSAVLWDLRCSDQPKPLELESARCYGANISFISSHQLVSVGGVSCVTGLDNHIELIDLRNMKSCSLERISRNNHEHLMLLNATTCHFEETKEVVSFGGGGNYFTFGTKFNQSHLIYHYAQEV